MSSGGEGAILAVPLVVAGVAVVGVALAAVAVAGAGVVVAQKTGQAVIACGRELDKMATENLKMQQAQRRAAREYESQLARREQAQMAQTVAQFQAELAAHRQEQTQRDHVIQQLHARMRQAPPVVTIDWAAVEVLTQQVLPIAPLPDNPPSERLSAWPDKLDRIQSLSDQLEAALTTFASGAAAGLFKTEYLEELIREAQQKLAVLQNQRTAVLLLQVQPDVEAVEEVLSRLTYLRRRLNEMETQTPQRQRERLEAVAAIEEARQALTATFNSVTAPSQLEGLYVAEQTLDDALVAIEEKEFLHAHASAEAVHIHLQTMEETVTRQRRRNLDLLLERLHEQIAPLQHLPELAADVQRWLQKHQRIVVQAGRDPVAAWEEIDADGNGLAPQAERLHRAALRLLKQQTTQSLSQATQESLKEMGYQVSRNSDTEGRETLIGQQGTRSIHVALSPSGEMAFKAEGFGDASCQTETEALLSRLKEKGVGGVWQQTFSLTDALQQLVLTLQGAGLNVKVEPSEDGATILASGAVRASGSVDYDGQVRLGEALQTQWQRTVRETPSVETDLTEEVRRRQKAHARQVELYALKEGNH